jgi:hypothetical protein
MFMNVGMFGMLECSNVRMFECWNVQMLECSNVGMFECWNVDMELNVVTNRPNNDAINIMI